MKKELPHMTARPIFTGVVDQFENRFMEKEHSGFVGDDNIVIELEKRFRKM